MIPPSYEITAKHKNVSTPSQVENPDWVPDGLIWGKWRGSDRTSVLLQIEKDPLIEAGTVSLFNTIGNHPSSKCNRGIFSALEDERAFCQRTGRNFPLPKTPLETDPDIPW